MRFEKLDNKNNFDNKSLAPLIIFFAVIILLTIIIINILSPEMRKTIEYDQTELLPAMNLSPFAREDRKRKATYRYSATLRPQGAKSLLYPENLLEQAKESLEKGDVRLAEEKLRNLLVFEPENREGLLILGDIFYASRRYLEAEVVFRRLLKLDPEKASIYNSLGASLAKQKKFDEAIKVTEKALIYEPNSPVAYLNLSGMHSVAGNKKTSIEYFKKAYDRVGKKILSISNDPTLDNIRSDPVFIAIVEDAEKNKGPQNDKQDSTKDTKVPETAK
jgi:tetratricopeptide (TPR) repeat protein